MEQISILLSSLSALTVIAAILFEGKIKAKNKNNSVISSLSKYGWYLIILSLLMGIGNGYTNYKNIRNNNDQYQQDTIRNNKIIKQLQEKRISDSLRITDLLKLTKNNGLKSDSIKLSVVDNAVRALEEQRRANERERENIFIHLQKEIKDNLSSILFHYDEKIINNYLDTTMFTIIRLNDIYIKKYELISNSKIIIENFMKISEAIKNSNFFADELLSVTDLNFRKSGINSFKEINNEIYNRLLFFYVRINNLKSYKEFETINFSTKVESVNREQLKKTLFFEVAFPVYDDKTKKELFKVIQ
jgi:hypothetical protein